MSLRDSVISVLAEWDAPDHHQDTLRQAVLGFVLAREDACRRACEPGHITASVAVLDPAGAATLLTLHPRIGRWVQLGGRDLTPVGRLIPVGGYPLSLRALPAPYERFVLISSAGVSDNYLLLVDTSLSGAAAITARVTYRYARGDEYDPALFFGLALAQQGGLRAFASGGGYNLAPPAERDPLKQLHTVDAYRISGSPPTLLREAQLALPRGTTPEQGLQVKTIWVARAISTLYPQITTIGGYRQDPLKWHPNGLAIDVMIPNYHSEEGIELGNEIAGLALANAKLGAVHGLAGVIGGLTGAPHGVCCAALLVPTSSVTIDALRADDAEHPALARYAAAGELLSGTAGIDALLHWLGETVRLLDVPPVGDLGVRPADHRRIAEQAAVGGRIEPLPARRRQRAGPGQWTPRSSRCRQWRWRRRSAASQ